MRPEEYEALGRLFLRATELRVDERQAFLDTECAGQPELRAQLERMLAADGETWESKAASDSAASLPPVPHIDGFVVKELIGEGGAGTVWRATQLSTNRDVALKLLETVRFTASRSRMRFEREVELAARLDDEGIARIYESGQADGCAYYAMELVDGLDLATWVSRRKLDDRGIVELMLAVCRAIQHAHQRGVIHRDLKPSNILVTEEGRPKVVDFGIATTLQSDDENAALLTAGVILGTPAYMSPEQAAGGREGLDTRSDVYSLGVVLYQCLTGQLPHGPTTSAIQAIRKVAEEEVRSPRAVRPDLDPELDAILQKALSRDPDQRYSAAGGLADDLQRYLQDEPISAHAPSVLYLLRKRLRKHRVAVAVAAVFFVLINAAVIGYVWITTQHADEALRLAKIADAERDHSEIARREADLVAYVHRLELIRLALEEFDFLYAREALLQCPEELRGFEWYYLWRQVARDERAAAVAGPFDAPARDIAFSPDGTTIAIAQASETEETLEDAFVPLIDSASGEVTVRLHGHSEGVTAVAFSPDGRELLTAGLDGTARRWDAGSGTAVEHVTVGGNRNGSSRLVVEDVEFSPDGAWCAFAIRGGGVWLAATPEPLTWSALLEVAERKSTPPGTYMARLAFSGDGERLAFVANSFDDLRGHMVVLETRSGAALGEQHSAAYFPFFSVDVSPWDGSLLVADDRETVSQYAPEGDRLIGRMGSHRGRVRRAAFTADEDSAVSVGDDGLVRIWDLRTRHTKDVIFVGPGVEGRAMAVDPARQRIAVAYSPEPVVRVWDIRSRTNPQSILIADHPPKARDFALSPDGTRIATVGDDGVLAVHAWPGGETLWTAAGEFPQATAIAWSEGGDRIAAGWSIHPNLKEQPPYGSIRVFAADDGEPLQESFTIPGWVWQIRFADGDRRLLVAYGMGDQDMPERAGGALLVDVRSGETIQEYRTPYVRCRSVAISPAGDVVAIGAEDDVLTFDAKSGTLLREVHASPGGRNFVAFVDDGQTLVTGDGAEIVFLTTADLVTRRRLAHPDTIAHQARAETVADVAFSPDGTRMVSVSWDGKWTIWDLSTGRALLSFDAHEFGAHHVRFSADGRTLFTSGHDGAVRAWHTEDG